MAKRKLDLPALPPGYRYVKEIAAGGQGVVWLVLNSNMGDPGRYEAAKILVSDSDSQDITYQRFYKEISTLATLSHPNIVTIYYASPKDSYFIMEYLEGGSLAALLESRQHTLVENLQIVRQVIDGLCVAHGKGLIHRDLKPHNILFSSSGVPKITDFGLAKAQALVGEDMTITHTIIGTPLFMSPEQWEDAAKADHRADIWALGIMLYQILTNRFPFPGVTGMGLMYATISKSIGPPRKITQLSELGKAVEPICMRALEKDLKKRYQSAVDMGLDLGKVLGVITSASTFDGARTAIAPSGSLKQESSALNFEDELTLKDESPVADTRGKAIASPSMQDTVADDKNISQADTIVGSRKRQSTAPMEAPMFRDEKNIADKQILPRETPLAFREEAQATPLTAPRKVGMPPKKQPEWLEKSMANGREIAMVVGALILLVFLYVFFKSPDPAKLKKNLAGNNRSLQLKTMKQLEKYNDRDALPVLLVALDSDYPKVRKIASKRLEKIGEDAVDTLLEGFSEVSRKEGKISILDFTSKYGDRSRENRVREIVNSVKSSQVKESAIKCLVTLNPDNKTDFSRYQGKWYSNWDLEEKMNCVRVSGLWRKPEGLVREARRIGNEAGEFVNNLRKREERDLFLNVEHPNEMDFEKWDFCLSFYDRSLDKLAILQKYESKFEIDELLADAYDKTSEHVISLLEKLTEIGEKVEKAKPGYGYRIYEQVERMYGETLSHTWNYQSQAKLERALKEHRRRMEKCRIGIEVVVKAKVLSDDNREETEQKLRKAIEYVLRRDNKLARFVENPEVYWEKRFLFSTTVDHGDGLPYGKLYEDLRSLFKENAYPVSAKAIVKVEKEGRFLIEDEKREFLAVMLENSLEIYLKNYAKKWCEFEYTHDESTNGTDCRFICWYKERNGNKKKIWDKELSAKYLCESAGEKRSEYWQNFREWRPQWKAIEGAYLLAISKKAEERACVKDYNGPVKIKGSTWDTEQDVIHLKNGKKRKGFIKRKTAKYLELVYFYRPSRDTIMVAREKISMKKIAKIDRIDDEERKVRLKEIKNLKKQLQKEKQAARAVKLQRISWPFVKGKTGWKYTGKRFVLMANTEREYVRTIVYRVQGIYDAYERFFKVERNQDKKIEIYVFNSMSEYYRATGGKIKNPAFYMPGKNLIAAGCDMAKYKAETAKVRQHHNAIRKQIDDQRQLITRYKGRLRNDVRKEIKKLDKKLRRGQINKITYKAELKSLSQQREAIQKEIRKYQKQLRGLEEKLRKYDYQNKEMVEKYTGNMLQVLYHESFHAFLQNFLFDQGDTESVPLWLNEGMAQFFENSFTSNGKLCVGKMGKKRVSLLKQYIHDGNTIPLAEFLVADSSEFLVVDQSDLENSTIHYLQSWAIVHYLTQQYNLRSGNFFDGYVKELKNGENPVVAFQHLVEMPLEKFDENWKQALLKWK